MADHTVVILCDRGKVVPAVLVVGRDDTVSFEAIGGGAEVTFHGTLPLGVQAITLGKRDEYASGPHQVEASAGIHAYSVWCPGVPGRSAQGDSDPIIIIRRPNRS